MRVFGFLSHTENVFFFVDRMSIFIYYFLRIFRFIYSFSILYSLAFFRFCFCRMMRARVVTSATKMIINEREKTLFFLDQNSSVCAGNCWLVLIHTLSIFHIIFFSRFSFCFQNFCVQLLLLFNWFDDFRFFRYFVSQNYCIRYNKKKLQIFPIPFPNVSVCVYRVSV